jgi:outer membrane protein assembly factor BamE (lipoprotein component of BamABCDE complex)
MCTVRRAASIHALILLLYLVPPSLAADPPKSTPDSPTLNQSNFDKIKSGKGKLTESDVITLLGKPTSKSGPYDGITTHIWLERTHITAKLKEDKTTDLQSQFLPYLKSKHITEENFKKLSKGMTAAQLKQILGQPNSLNNRDDITTLSWERVNSFEIQFKDAKVEGWTWFRSLEDDKRPANP